MTESVAILLYPLLALCSLRLFQAPSVRRAIITGVVLGLTALNKPIILGFAPIWLLWLGVSFVPHWRKALLLGGIVIATWSLVMLPWGIRNYRLFGKVIPVTVQAGWAMYEANNPYTDYALRRVEHGQTWLNDPRIHEPLQGLAGLSALEFDAKLRGLAMEFVREHPGRAIEYALRRVRVFWGAYDHPAHRAYWYIVGPLFVVGVTLAWKICFRNWRELALPSLLILQTMSLVIFFASMPRYRVPIEPFVLVFAAYGLNAGVLAGRAVLQRGRSRAPRKVSHESEELP